MNKLAAHADNIALHNLIFSLPFSFLAALLAAGGKMPWYELGWITLAIFGGRSAALSLNNIFDLQFDSKQQRLQGRALVSGAISHKEAWGEVAVGLIVCLFAVSRLRPLCLYLLPVAVVPFVIYPFLKRWTWLCHAGLGLAIAMAPAGAWVAVQGQITLPMLVICTAVGLWIGAFDAAYSCQDEEFDRSQGLHSLATRFTARGALRLTRAAHGCSVICFLLLGQLLHLGWLYYVGVAVAAVTLAYQHSIVSPGDYHRVTKAYFLRNGIVSTGMFLFTWLSFNI